MALIESLIDKVEDPKLKARFLAEVKALKERKDFGLVFERHLPESVLLPHTVGVEAGAEVRLRKEWNKPDNFIVTSAKIKLIYIFLEKCACAGGGRKYTSCL